MKDNQIECGVNHKLLQQQVTILIVRNNQNQDLPQQTKARNNGHLQLKNKGNPGKSMNLNHP
jgi:hypothetical protein